VAVKAGITPPAQYDLSPPLTGGSTIGQLQFGAVTARVFTQPPAVTVTIILIPDSTPDIVHTPPMGFTFTGVPAVLVTNPDGGTVIPRE
jgi:hypothetical protein